MAKVGDRLYFSLNETGCKALESGRHLQTTGKMIPQASSSLDGRRLYQTVGKLPPNYTASHIKQYILHTERVDNFKS